MHDVIMDKLPYFKKPAYNTDNMGKLFPACAGQCHTFCFPACPAYRQAGLHPMTLAFSSVRAGSGNTPPRQSGPVKYGHREGLRYFTGLALSLKQPTIIAQPGSSLKLPTGQFLNGQPSSRSALLPGR